MVSAADELATQFAAAGAVPSALYVAAGSGLTVAGLALGFKHLGVPTRVAGVSVQRPKDFMVPLIVRRANEAAELLGLATRIAPGDFDFDDDQIGPGYGVPTAEGIAAMALAGRTEGLVLDPVYTGKAMAGLVSHVRRSRHAPHHTLAFFHSGGAPGLFAHAEAVVEALPAP
jgi:1-aminocyclopropane-1-carboxylate deaminase/D-cysteine desulfhydrase-like pyridoxal-dependent ACC family enzyme